jgi:hypothetical protein
VRTFIDHSCLHCDLYEEASPGKQMQVLGFAVGTAVLNGVL